MQELIDKVQELVAFELERANTIHPPKFNSMHEAYAVMLEELDEAKEELDELQRLMVDLWELVKADCDEETLERLHGVECRAVKAVAEVIQCAAMARKARM